MKKILEFCKKCGEILGLTNMYYDADYSTGKRVITRQYYKCRNCGLEEDIDVKKESNKED